MTTPICAASSRPGRPDASTTTPGWLSRHRRPVTDRPDRPGHGPTPGGAESRRAARLLAGKHPLLQGVLVPLTHRLGRAKTGKTVHFQLTPLDHGQAR
jgi:hypothetical protein